MLSSIIDNKGPLHSVVTMPEYPSVAAELYSVARLKDLGITPEQVAKAALVQNEDYFDAIVGIVDLWKPFAVVLQHFDHCCSFDQILGWAAQCILDVCRQFTWLEGDNTTLGDAYWAIEAISETMAGREQLCPHVWGSAAGEHGCVTILNISSVVISRMFGMHSTLIFSCMIFGKKAKSTCGTQPLPLPLVFCWTPSIMTRLAPFHRVTE